MIIVIIIELYESGMFFNDTIDENVISKLLIVSLTLQIVALIKAFILSEVISLVLIIITAIISILLMINVKKLPIWEDD